MSVRQLLDEKIYPAMMELHDQVFPEFAFERMVNGWRSTTGTRADGTFGSVGRVYVYDDDLGYLKDFSRHPLPFWDYVRTRDGIPPDAMAVLKRLADLAGVALPPIPLDELSGFSEEQERQAILRSAQEFLDKCLFCQPDEGEYEYFGEFSRSIDARHNRIYLSQMRRYSRDELRRLYDAGRGFGLLPSQPLLFEHLIHRCGHRADAVSRAIGFVRGIGDTHKLSVPLVDHRGDIRGFAFRAIGTGIEPSYLYTTGLRRNDTLFYLPHFIVDRDVVIVKGVYDALIAKARGISNICALSGTDFSHAQADVLVRRGAEKVTLCFDADDAGETATFYAINILKQYGIPTYVARLPLNIKDPDELMRNQGVEAFLECVKNAVRWYRYSLDSIVADAGQTDKNIDLVVREIVTMGSGIKSPVEREQYIRDIANYPDLVEIGIDESHLAKAIEELCYDRNRERRRDEFRAAVDSALAKVESGLTDEALDFLYDRLGEIRAADRAGDFAGLLAGISEKALGSAMRESPLPVRSGYMLGADELELPAHSVTAVTARPSHGITTFLLNLLLNAAEFHPDRQFHFFSYETDGSLVLLSALNAFANLDMSRNNRRSIAAYFADGGGDVHFTNKPALREFEKRKNIFFETLVSTKRLNIHGVGYSADLLCDAIRFLRREKAAVGAVFIDHLHLLHKGERGKNKYTAREEELRQICLDLKDVALETGVPVVIGVPTNGVLTGYLEMTVDALGESGRIGSVASLVLGLWNDAVPASTREMRMLDMLERDAAMLGTLRVVILKNRNGAANLHGAFRLNRNTGRVKNV